MTIARKSRRVPKSAGLDLFWAKDWYVWLCAAELILVSAWVARHFLSELRQMGAAPRRCVIFPKYPRVRTVQTRECDGQG